MLHLVVFTFFIVREHVEQSFARGNQEVSGCLPAEFGCLSTSETMYIPRCPHWLPSDGHRTIKYTLMLPAHLSVI